MTTHEFKKSFKRGKDGEEFLDRYFADKFDIHPVDMTYERMGIDRLFWKNGKQYLIEYKTDFLTGRTGNIFLELNFKNGEREGWVKTTQADFVLYYAPKGEYQGAPSKIYIFNPTVLREWLPTLERRLQKRTVWNDWNGLRVSAHGLLLPHVQAIDIATKIIYLDDSLR